MISHTGFAYFRNQNFQDTHRPTFGLMGTVFIAINAVQINTLHKRKQSEQQENGNTNIHTQIQEEHLELEIFSLDQITLNVLCYNPTTLFAAAHQMVPQS